MHSIVSLIRFLIQDPVTNGGFGNTCCSGGCVREQTNVTSYKIRPKKVYVTVKHTQVLTCKYTYTVTHIEKFRV